MKIGNRISEYRRNKGATQEQLADFAGVSVAAVSKWETDSSLPDITLLPSIAEFFGVSIDALLDFDIAKTNIDIEMLRDSSNKYIKNCDYNAGLPLYADAVSKYPNDYNIIRNYAELLSAKACSTFPTDTDTARLAIEYREKALLLHNEKVTGEDKESLYQGIAFLYGSIGEYDMAINFLEKTLSKEYEALMANYILKTGRYDEAKRRVQSVLFNSAFNFSLLTGVLVECFNHDDDADLSLRLTEMNACFREFFANADKANYFDMLSSDDYMRLADAYKNSGDTDKMWSSLTKAVYHAVRFDKNPSYNMEDVRFMKGYAGSFSTSSGENACHSLLRKIKSDYDEYKSDPRYNEFIAKLENSKRDKTESGIWE